MTFSWRINRISLRQRSPSLEFLGEVVDLGGEPAEDGEGGVSGGG